MSGGRCATTRRARDTALGGCGQRSGCTLLAHVPLAHTLLLVMPILAAPILTVLILADTPSTHLALTRSSHAPHQRAPLLATPIPWHSPLAIRVVTRKGSGDDAGWWAGCESEGLLARLNWVQEEVLQDNLLDGENMLNDLSN